MEKNILYIHTHDSGRFLEPFGWNIPTPRIMQLAREGTLFRNTFCAAPTCSPSRVGLLTGMSPHSTNMLGLAQRGFQMDDYKKHLSNFLKRNGYHTCLFGVQHEAPETSMIGYDYYYEADCQESDFMSRDTGACTHAAQYLKDYHENKPFFMSVGFIHTHREYPQDAQDYINPDYVTPPFTVADTKENRKDMAAYMRSAQIADDCVKVVLDALKESGREDDTNIIFTTDHGIAFPFMKCNCYDTGIGVTLIMKYKDNPATGKVCDSLISQIDLFPTLCDMNGLEKPDYLQGKSFIKVFEDLDTEINQEIFSEVTYHAAYEPMRCIRTKRYKLIRYYDFHNGYVPANIDESSCKELLINSGLLQKPRAREMLFDLYIDPMERENLIENPAYKDIYTDLRIKLEKWMEETNDPLIPVSYRVPKPEDSYVNRLQDLDPNCLLRE
ncbi:MAG: sulfatase [Lachnospiraceae bacterium]